MKKSVRSLMAIAVFGVSSIALADDLADFFRQTVVGNVSARMFHDQGRYIVNVGNQMTAMNKAELLDLYQKMKAAGAKIEIISLKLTNRVDTGNMVSVVVKAKVRQTVGSSRGEGEVESREILLKEGGKYVSVFSLGKQ